MPELLFLAAFFLLALCLRIAIWLRFGMVVGVVVSILYCAMVAILLVWYGSAALLLPIGGEQFLAGIADPNLLFPGLSGPTCPPPGGDPYLATFTSPAIFLLYMGNAALNAAPVLILPIAVVITVLGTVRALRAKKVNWLCTGSRLLMPWGLLLIVGGDILLRIISASGVC